MGRALESERWGRDRVNWIGANLTERSYNFPMARMRSGLLALLMVFSLSANTWANERFERVGGLMNIGGGQSEFKNSNRNNRLLIEVNMLSGVIHKGIHQVPDDINLVDMVSLAGGPEDRADLSEVHIKRKGKGGFSTLSYNLEKLVESPTAGYPTLSDGDVVMIERSSIDNWVTALGIVGVTLGIVASGFLIRNELKKN